MVRLAGVASPRREAASDALRRIDQGDRARKVLRKLRRGQAASRAEAKQPLAQGPPNRSRRLQQIGNTLVETSETSPGARQSAARRAPCWRRRLRTAS